MNVVVICVEELEGRPPVIQLVRSLLALGHHVTLIGRHVWSLPSELSENARLSTLELNDKRQGFARIADSMRDKRVIRRFLQDNVGKIDLVWTATDISAREAGKSLLNHRYVMQLPELVEFIPSLRLGGFYFHDKTVPMLARAASRVVVPEYNRAHIQKIWWGLDRTPAVLPNKTEVTDFKFETDKEVNRISRELESEPRKILLYQGGFTSDRDFEPVARSLKLLNDEYALYLMGPVNTGEEKARIDHLCDKYANVRYVGFVSPPKHLQLTKYGYIGLLPYSPASDKTRASNLNALYCAPNKVWEYTQAGLPMLGSDVPGLSTIFFQNHMGITMDLDKPELIAEGVKTIESDYEGYSRRSRAFYSSINVMDTVGRILDEALDARR